MAYAMNSPRPINSLVYQEQERHLNLTEHTRAILQQLKMLDDRPEKPWIVDFKYVSMPKRYLPISLQLAIRQLEGTFALSRIHRLRYVHEEFMHAIPSYGSGKHKIMGTLFLRCYGELSTHGIRHSGLEIISWRFAGTI